MKNIYSFANGLRIEPSGSSVADREGELEVISGKLKMHDGTVSREFVTLNNTQTLTNKTLTGNTAANLISGSGTLTLNTSGTITVPNATDTLVGKATSDTLTNKTMSGASNTFSNIGYSSLVLTTSIVDGDISASAAIAYSKLATMATGQVLLGNAGTPTATTLSGDITVGATGVTAIGANKVTDAMIRQSAALSVVGRSANSTGNVADISAGADYNILRRSGTAIGFGSIDLSQSGAVGSSILPIANGGTGQSSANAGFNALAPSTTKGDIIVHTGSVNARQGIGSDNQVLVADSSQTNGLKWTTLQQGAKNYIVYNNFENNAITGWNEISATYSSNTPSGTPTISSSAAANLTIAATSTTPLAGTYSMLATLTAPSAGVGFCTDALTIDREDLAKVLQWSFYYEVKSGSGNFSGTSSNTFSVWILQDNGSTLTWTQPAGVYNMVQSSGQGFASGTFQTNSDTTTVRLVVFVNASATISVNFDDFYLGPQKVVYGSPVTDWVSYTPTVSNNTGGITNNTNTAKWRRVGDSIELDFNITFTGTPANFSGLFFSLPSGLTIDTSKLASGAQGNVYGYGAIRDFGVANYLAIARYSTTSLLEVLVDQASGTYVEPVVVTQAIPITFGNTDIISVRAMVPVVGWSSTVQMSNDTDTRVVSASAYRITSAQTITAGADREVVFNQTLADTHGAFSTSTGRFTAPVPGYYNVAWTARITMGATAAASVVGYVKVNGGSTQYAGWLQDSFANSKTYTASSSEVIYLNAGDYVSLFLNATTNDITTSFTGGSNSSTFITIQRVSGPSAIAASETVAASAYRATSGQTITAGNNTAIVFNTKEGDSHGAFSTSTGLFTVPTSGKYQVAFNIQALMGATAASTVEVWVWKGGTGKRYGYIYQDSLANSKTYTYSGAPWIQCVAGDTIGVYIASGTQNITVQSTGGTNDVSGVYFTRIGN